MATGRLIRNFDDIIGKISGRLTVTLYLYSENIGESNKKKHWYGCLCTCGTEITVTRRNILSGDVISCGCQFRELHKISHERHKKGQDITKILLKTLYSTNINKAAYRGFEFTLDKKYHDELVLDNCHYCGIAPSNTFKRNAGGELKYSGIDRIDSDQGYVEGNVVPCCIFCNRAKMDLSYQDFKSYIKRLIDFNS